jgi:surfactin synthase thioesterase subunit
VTRASPRIGLVRPHPRPDARLRLLCVPYAGGGSAVFSGWPALLDPEIEVCAVQLPGRESRFMHPAFDDTVAMMPVLGELIAADVAPPYAFFGHSMGAIVAFELARWLRAANLPMPVHLLVSARRAPQLPPLHPQVHVLSDDAFLDYIRRLGGTPARMVDDTRLMRLLLPMLRADFAVNDGYRFRPEAPLNCPITACGGLSDDHVPRQSMAGWREQTTRSFHLAMFRGGHFYLRHALPALIRVVQGAVRQPVGD